MASGNVEVRFTGDAASLEREITKLKAKAQQLQDKLRDVGGAGRKSGDELSKLGNATAKAFDTSGLMRMASFLAPGGMLVAGAALLRAEFEKIIRLQEQAAGAQLTLGSARKDIVRNLAGSSPADITAVLQAGSKIASRTGVEERFIASGLASALSASGGNIPGSMAAVEEAAKFLPDRPESIPEFAGSLLDLSKITGTMDARTNRGLLALVGSMSRVVDPARQAKNIPPALIGMRGVGATPQEAAALFATITESMADTTGEMSGTAAIQLGRQLEKFFIPPTGPSVADTMGERIRFLQENPGHREAFMKDASFEAKAFAPIRDLLRSSTTAVAESFARNQAKIPGTEELRRIADEQVMSFGLDPLESTARLSRVFAAGRDQSLVSQIASGRAGATRKGLRDLLETTGTSAIADRMMKGAFEWNSNFGREDPVAVAERIIERRIGDIEAPTRGPERDEYSRLRGLTRAARPLTGEEQESVSILKDVLTELRYIHQGLRGGPSLGGSGEDK